MTEPQHIKDLKKLGFASNVDRTFHKGTRDDPSLWVMQGQGGVFYLDRCVRKPQPFQNRTLPNIAAQSPDVTRRVSWINQRINFASVKNACDLGSGSGGLTFKLRSRIENLHAVEPDPQYRGIVAGVTYYSDISEVPDNSMDLIACMHVIEHFTNPLDTLKEVHKKLTPDGLLFFEVPHAQDYLIQKSMRFRNHTFWSEHLILHNMHSLHSFLSSAGFLTNFLEFTQRYGLENHRMWIDDMDEFTTFTEQEYVNWLMSARACDTILGISGK